MPESRQPIDDALAMAGVLRSPPARAAAVVVRDHSGAASDERLIDLWLKRYDSEHTRVAYESDVVHLQAFLGLRAIELRTMTVADLSDFIEQLTGAEATRARRISSVKSLLTFGHETGYLQFNIGAAIKTPRLHDHVAERILTMDQVRQLLEGAVTLRDRAFIRFLYVSGARVSEATALQWKHVRRDGKLRVTLHGKGKKTRHLLLLSDLLKDLNSLEKVRLGTYVFESVHGRRLSNKSAWNIIRGAASRSYLRLNVSPHWLRHAHATHALQRGAPIRVVQNTLGHSNIQTTARYAHITSDESSALFLKL